MLTMHVLYFMQQIKLLATSAKHELVRALGKLELAEVIGALGACRGAARLYSPIAVLYEVLTAQTTRCS